MKKYALVNSGVLLIGLLLIIYARDDVSILGGFIKLIGFSLTLVSSFLVICYFFGLTLSRLP
jgi:hypothetical protein